MKILFLIFFSLSWSVTASADDSIDCSESGTTYCQSQNARSAYENADAKLNENYKLLVKALTHYKLEKKKDLLIKTQREWIKYRDLNCELSDQIIGGINSVSWIGCMEEMTTMRANELSELTDMYDLSFLEK